MRFTKQWLAKKQKKKKKKKKHQEILFQIFRSTKRLTINIILALWKINTTKRKEKKKKALNIKLEWCTKEIFISFHKLLINIFKGNLRNDITYKTFAFPKQKQILHWISKYSLYHNHSIIFHKYKSWTWKISNIQFVLKLYKLIIQHYKNSRFS